MDSGGVVRTIGENPLELINRLNGELKANLGTSHYHRLSDEELIRRHSHIFRGLTQWLISQDEGELRKNGEDLGNRRFHEGTPLGQVVLVLILVERIFLEYLETSGQRIDEETRRSVEDFFQKTIYYTAKGYEVALAVSNRMTKKPAAEQMPDATATPDVRAGKAPARVTKEGDMEISRGGQVGEFGG
jgi:hypothetical protein